jgi:hypothetical protein
MTMEDLVEGIQAAVRAVDSNVSAWRENAAGHTTVCVETGGGPIRQATVTARCPQLYHVVPCPIWLWQQLVFLKLNISRHRYLLKPTHAQLKTHVKTQCFNTLKCPCPYRPTCFGHVTDHPQGLNVSRTATCSPYVVFLHNLTLACGLLSVYVAVRTSPLLARISRHNFSNFPLIF